MRESATYYTSHEHKKLVKHAVAEAEYSLVKKMLSIAERESVKGKMLEVALSVGLIEASAPVVKAAVKRRKRKK